MLIAVKDSYLLLVEWKLSTLKEWRSKPKKCTEETELTSWKDGHLKNWPHVAKRWELLRWHAVFAFLLLHSWCRPILTWTRWQWMHIEAAALQQVVFAISSHKCPPPICIKLTPTLVADYVCHDRFFVREAGNVLDDHNNNYDDGYPAYSHHDKIPPWWGNVSNDEGGNVSVSKTHHTPWWIWFLGRKWKFSCTGPTF